MVYCKRCAAEVAVDDEFCIHCGAALDERPAGDLPDDRWWLGLLVHPATFFLAFGLGFVGGFYRGVGNPAAAALFFPVASAVEILGIVAGLVAAPAAVYHDRQYLEATARWKPSPLAYLAAVPYLGILVAAVYLFYRYRETR